MSTEAEAKLCALAELSQLLGDKLDLDSRISRAFTYLAERLGYEHSMLLVPADTPGSLVMLASHGYAAGVGAHVKLGEGTIGVCAERRRSIRINGVQRALGMLHASQPTPTFRQEIPLPGLPRVESQLACPAVMHNELVGVLYVEDARQGRYTPDDSSALQLVASLLAPALFHESDEADSAPPVPSGRIEASPTPLRATTPPTAACSSTTST